MTALSEIVRDVSVDACPLCGSAGASEWYREPQREYWRCGSCALVFLSPELRLSFEAEVERYRLHRNRNDDAGYLKFLSRLAEPMAACTPPRARGLDYGSGSATALALLMTQSGRPTASYDPVFHPNSSTLGRHYEFVTCSEVLEHVHQPLTLLEELERRVIQGGKIGIMTQWYDGHTPFGTWHYPRDPTHVCFYAERTMQWIAEHFGWELMIPARDIAIYATGRARNA